MLPAVAVVKRSRTSGTSEAVHEVHDDDANLTVYVNAPGHEHTPLQISVHKTCKDALEACEAAAGTDVYDAYVNVAQAAGAIRAELLSKDGVLDGDTPDTEVTTVLAEIKRTAQVMAQFAHDNRVYSTPKEFGAFWSTVSMDELVAHKKATDDYYRARRHLSNDWGHLSIDDLKRESSGDDDDESESGSESDDDL
jgi:hypothetical protein